METTTERIKFWLTDKELKQIDRIAKKLGMNRSEYIRHIISRYGLSEAIKMKYHRFSKALNNYDCEILYKGLFAEAHYGEDRK